MAYQIGYADDWKHLHYLLRNFITGKGIPPENGAVAGSNTGNGTLTRIHGTDATVTETWTVTLTDATNFSVTGSVSGAQAAGVVGTPYTNSFVEFEVNAGTVAFVASDSFTFDMVVNPLQASGKWKIERENAVEDFNTELCLQAPGDSGLDVAPYHYFGLDTPGTGDPPYIRVISHSEFNLGNSFYGQVGYPTGNNPTLSCWEFRTKYWFIGSARRCLVLTRVYDRYFTMAFGVLNAYATPAQWPQPHFIAGSSYGAFQWENPDGRIGNFPAGSSDSLGSINTFMRVFGPDLVWDYVNVFYQNGDYTWNEETTADTIGCWPWSERVQEAANGTYMNALQGPHWKYLVEGPDGTFPLIPVQYYRRQGASQAIYGTVDGVYATTGGWLANELSVVNIEGPGGSPTPNPTRLSPEDIILVGADKYIVFPTTPLGRRRGNWAAFKLE